MIRLIFLGVFFIFGIAHAEENRTALVIGNADYRISPLANSGNDAEDIAAILTALNFNVILRVDVGLREMDEAVTEFGIALSQNKGVGLFFYAGHGAQLQGENYLIPTDFTLERESDIKYRSLNVGTVLDEMRGANNHLNIVILDACRDNFLAGRTRGSSMSMGLAYPLNVPTGTLIAYSTAPGKQAADIIGKNSRNSPYTTALIEAIQKTNIPLETVFKNVTRKVKELTDEKQIPWVSSSVDGDFFFSKQEEMPMLVVNTPLSLEEQQRYNEYKDVIDELILENEFKKARIYVEKLFNINPQSSEVSLYREKIDDGIKLQRQAFNELKGVVKNILSNEKLTEKQAEKVSIYLSKLKSIDPESEEVDEFIRLYKSKPVSDLQW